MKGVNKLAFFIGGIVSIFLIVSVVSASGNNLWKHFNGALPSLSDRAIIYNQNFPEKYKGFAEQNIRLHSVLDGELKFGALAFPPSTVEGTSTAGWTDDGSNVRLNTAADFVGIGTANPGEKLTVTGGNFQLNGDIIMSGGDFTFGSTNSGTSTLTVANSGRLGIGTTTPRATFSVGGDVMISGTTTVGGLVSTSTLTTNLTVSGTATSSFTGAINVPTGQCFQVNGTCIISATALGTPVFIGENINLTGGSPCPCFFGTGTSTVATTTARPFIMARAGTLSDFFVNINGTQNSPSGLLRFQILVNEASTSLQVSFDGNGTTFGTFSATNTSFTSSVLKGDRVLIRLINNMGSGNILGGGITASFLIQ